MGAAAHSGAGGWGINDDGAEAYIKAYEEMLVGLQDMEYDLDIAAQPAPLGGDEFAQDVARFTARSAQGDEQSLATAVAAAIIVCEEAIAAFRKAKQAYREVDEAGAETFRSTDFE